MSAANLISAIPSIKIEPAFLPPIPGLPMLGYTAFYLVNPVVPIINNTFFPTETGLYMAQFSITYDNSLVVAPGAVIDILFGGTIFMSLPGTALVLPTIPSPSTRTSSVSAFITELGGDILFEFDTNITGITAGNPVCTMALAIYGPFH